MGVTAVWLTPLFEQIEAMVWDSAPIHGYWTRDFKRIHARWVSGEDEVRFFVAGSGLFTLHVGGKVYEVECVQDDLIAVPDSTLHWFDMGEEPSFIAIRFFTEPDGWVGHFTGEEIAKKFPRYEPGKSS